MSQDPNANPNAPYGQPAPEQPNYATQPAQDQPVYGQTYAAPAPQAQDPGQTLGILALVFAFVFAPVGIVLGVLARKKSREAGLPDNALGKWGFILGIIFTIIWVIYVVATIIITVIAVSSASSSYGSLLGAF